MANYLLRRLLLIIPTLFGLLVITFAIVQFAPGGPVEQVIARLQGLDGGSRIGGGGGDAGLSGPGAGGGGSDVGLRYRGAQGLDPNFIRQLERQFGYDRPWYERFGLLVWNYAR